MFTTAICPRLMNVCSQKHGEIRKMEVKNLRKHVQRRQEKCSGQKPFCSWMRTPPVHEHGDDADSLNVSISLATPNPFSFSTSPLSATWAHPSHQALTWSMSIQRGKTTVLGDPVSFHPVTLCRANHSHNVLTVKLLLSFFSTKFSHNNSPSYFLPIKYMNS